VTAVAFDLCAGARGWEADLDEDDDLHTIGFDVDPDACATARAAGLFTVQDDIARLVPAVVALVYGNPEGIIGSPPCQLFSGAGKGTGRLLMEELHRAITDAARGASDIVMARHRRELRRLLHRYLVEAEGYKRARGSRHRTAKGKPYTVEATPIRRGELRAEAGRMARNVSLVWQPARWVAALRPRWVALEQVPAVLPLWEAMARGLEVHGYRCWTGVLSAERYGVPQTRKRAVLLACLDRQPQPPEATHQAYVPGEPAREGEPDLFGPGLKAWVSMAQALGWGMTERPVTTVTAGSSRQGGPDPLDGGSGARATIRRERDEGRWVVKTRGDSGREHDEFSADAPSRAITGKSGSWERLAEADPDDIEIDVNRGAGMLERYGERRPRKGSEPAPTIRGGGGGCCGPNLTVKLVNGTHEHRAERDIDEPAPTLHFGGRLNTVSFVTNAQTHAATRNLDEPAPTIKGGHDTAERQWVVDTGNTRGFGGVDPDSRRNRGTDEPAPAITSRADQLERRDAPTHYDSRQQSDRRTGEPKYARRRALDEPAPTIAGESRNDAWATERGGQQRSGAGHTDGTARDTAVRVSVQEAAILQSFPPDWPWQGVQTSQFQQVGNAIPPRLGRAILRAVRGRVST
jgi:DNA (cytosine-5)-methyltransferase 1